MQHGRVYFEACKAVVEVVHSTTPLHHTRPHTHTHHHHHIAYQAITQNLITICHALDHIVNTL